MKKLMMALIAAISFMVLSVASAAYVAEFEILDKSDGSAEHMIFTVDGENASMLFKQADGQVNGMYRVDGVNYSASQQRGEWQVVNMDEMMEKMAAFRPMQRPSADTRKSQEVELVDLKKKVEHAGYQGKLYKVVVREDGRISNESTIVLSEHKDIKQLSDDQFSFFEPMAKRAEEMGAQTGIAEMMEARDALAKAKGGMLHMADDDGSFSLVSLKKGTGGPVKLPAEPQDPMAGMAGPGMGGSGVNAAPTEADIQKQIEDLKKQFQQQQVNQSKAQERAETEWHEKEQRKKEQTDASEASVSAQEAAGSTSTDDAEQGQDAGKADMGKKIGDLLKGWGR